MKDALVVASYLNVVKTTQFQQHCNNFKLLGMDMSLALAWLPIETQIRFGRASSSLRIAIRPPAALHLEAKRKARTKTADLIHEVRPEGLLSDEDGN
jgi:hypothetical protein